MRRSKIKATVCVGRRMTDTSRKAEENRKENAVSVVQNDSLDTSALNEVQSQSEDVPSACPITLSESIPQASPLQQVEQVNSLPQAEQVSSLPQVKRKSSLPKVDSELTTNSTSSIDSVLTNSSECMPSKISNTDQVIPKSIQENSLRLFSRRTLKRVPNLQNRKTKSSGTLQEESKSDSIKNSTDNKCTSPTSFDQESTSNSPANVCPAVNIISPAKVSPTSPNKICRTKIKEVPVLGDRKELPSFSDSEDGSKQSNSFQTRTESCTSPTSFDQESTSNSPANVCPAVNIISPAKVSPTSPNKICRTKIKEVPVLEDRKKLPSFSDSEDGSKQSNSCQTRRESHISNTSCDKESTSNLPANVSPAANIISHVIISPAYSNKICRTKIKAVPILGNRKKLPSVSDSDDGSKKMYSSRTRTESQSSSISGIQDTTVEQTSPHKRPENSGTIKRKNRKSEGSSKLAEARREFAKKYVDGKPDHKRLTMMDLIFYNPATNPMKYDKRDSKITEETLNPDKQKEEDVDNPIEVVDDPSEKDEQINESDDEGDIIAPQIKVGPNGEIVLDEKSLVIENKKAKKAQEAMEKLVAIDGDLDRPYGVYKRPKRSKDWTQSETVKFYRALSTVGTDFSLMSELFPKRTRRELKMKFKKEEKINQTLVDQAIMKPCNFNYEELKTEFEMMDIEEHEIEQQQLKEQELNKKKQNKRSAKFIKITQDNNSIHNESGDVSNTKKVESMNEKKPVKKRTIRPKVPKPPKQLDIFSALRESDPSDQESTDSEQSFVLQSTQTTRYGRKTKRREIYEPNVDPDDELIIPKKIRILNPEPAEPIQKPGSIMMISSETPDGQPVVKIFMVTDDKATNGKENEINPQNLLPIAMIRTGHDDKAEEEIIENNYTIPADTEDNLREQNIEETHKDFENEIEIVEEKNLSE